MLLHGGGAGLLLLARTRPDTGQFLAGPQVASAPGKAGSAIPAAVRNPQENLWPGRARLAGAGEAGGRWHRTAGAGAFSLPASAGHAAHCMRQLRPDAGSGPGRHRAYRSHDAAARRFIGIEEVTAALPRAAAGQASGVMLRKIRSKIAAHCSRAVAGSSVLAT
jgi:hypothetical protein